MAMPNNCIEHSMHDSRLYDDHFDFFSRSLSFSLFLSAYLFASIFMCASEKKPIQIEWAMYC